ncbi:Dabb family protein [Sphingobacterium psychroaquaticum]|uniref:Dabb family protein n=1 Tax=Sphingobacterium psychroaquaticum TaxID=561061 RepID=UPI00106DA5A0|nr:Dabb family protein [Sphingobacterium psychroaquaticum]QBQ40599.1 Dabb family protein [Sphingobacterium psychroaquaticum]
MQRNQFIKSLALASLAAPLASACTSQNETSKHESEGLHPAGTIVHAVYFWLKEDLTDDDKKDFLNFFEALRKVPGIRSFQYGKPASTTPRPVVDNSFSYNLVVTFKSMDDINTYEKHPDHLAAADKYSKYWSKVLVMDTVLEA